MTIADYESRCVLEDAALERGSRLVIVCGNIDLGAHYDLRFEPAGVYGGKFWFGRNQDAFGDGDTEGDGAGDGGDDAYRVSESRYHQWRHERAMEFGDGTNGNATGGGSGFGDFSMADYVRDFG